MAQSYSPRLVRKGAMMDLRRPLSPNSLRRSVQRYSDRFEEAQTSDEKRAIAADALQTASEGLVRLLGWLVASPFGDRFQEIQREVLARVANSSCDWDFMRDTSDALLAIAMAANVTAVAAESEREFSADGGLAAGSSSESGKTIVRSSAPSLLEQLRELQGRDTSAVQLDAIKRSVRALIEKNWDIFEGVEHAELREIIYAEKAEVVLADGYCKDLIEALIAACEVIDFRHEEVLRPAGVLQKQVKKQGPRGYCNPGRVLIAGLLTAAVAVFAKVLIEKGMVSF